MDSECFHSKGLPEDFAVKQTANVLATRIVTFVRSHQTSLRRIDTQYIVSSTATLLNPSFEPNLVVLTPQYQLTSFRVEFFSLWTVVGITRLESFFVYHEIQKLLLDIEICYLFLLKGSVMFRALLICGPAAAVNFCKFYFLYDCIACMTYCSSWRGQMLAVIITVTNPQ